MNLLNKIDPMLWMMNLLHHKVLNISLSDPSLVSNVKLIRANIEKHRKIRWLVLVVGVLAYFALRGYTATSPLFALIATLLVPILLVTGSAWYLITFEKVRNQYLPVAIDVTFLLYAAFLSSMIIGVIVIFLASADNILLTLIVFAIILALDAASTLYDSNDALNSGYLSKMSMAADAQMAMEEYLSKISEEGIKVRK